MLRSSRCSYWLAVLAACVLSSTSGLVAQTLPGIPPRPAPNDYLASQQTRLATYAASMVPASEVKHIFLVDITKAYVVVEVACYPNGSTPVDLQPDDFLIKLRENGEFLHAVDSATVASVMQQKNTPRPPSKNSPAIYTEANIGYESGTDPYTGRRVHGIYTGGGVGVAPGGDPVPPYPPPPGSTPQDRKSLEAQLSSKALPGGSFTAPVAGFVYFPAESLKKHKGSYELHYMGDPSGKVVTRISIRTQ